MKKEKQATEKQATEKQATEKQATEKQAKEEIEIINVKDLWVLGITKLGYYKEIANCITNLRSYADKRGIKITGSPIFLCHELTREEAKGANARGDAEIEVCIPVDGDVEIDEYGKELEIKSSQLKGGQMAKIIHKGPYEKCHLAYNKLFLWMEKNKKQITNPIREIYLNDPNRVKQEEILTEILAPIE
jgi:effector-binding domain-containing protein